MQLSDIVNGLWAITPEMHDEIMRIYATHLRGDKIDIAGVEAKLGRPLANEQKGYTIQDGVAVLPLHGVIGKKMNLMTRISGGVSTQMVAAEFRAALEDPAVKSILLHIDSPGGTVDGTMELADTIFAARGQKPIVALADGVMASAAYWIGSAADQVFAMSDLTQVGSIGVIARHEDISRMLENGGVKTSLIYAGKFKAVGDSSQPLDSFSRQAIQEDVNQVYDAFVSAVARNRGVPLEQAQALADGKIFRGKQAIIAGLVDGVSTFDALLASMSAGDAGLSMFAQAGGPTQLSTTQETTMNNQNAQLSGTAQSAPAPLTLDALRSAHPDLAEAIRAEAHQAGLTAGAEQERQRIQSVRAQAMPGHEALIERLAADGKSTGADAAMAIIQAEKETRKSMASAIQAERPAPVAPSMDAEQPSASLPLEERCRAEWSKSEKLQAEFIGGFDTYLAFKKAEASGQAKILGKE